MLKFENRISRLGSDDSGDYMSEEMKKFYEEKGIRLELTVC